MRVEASPTRLAVGLLLAVLVAGCGEATPPSGTGEAPTTVRQSFPTGDTIEEYHPFNCQLPVMLRQNHGAVVGTATSIEGPFFDETAINEEGREYWLLTVEVDTLVPDTLEVARQATANKNPQIDVPEIVIGTETQLVVHPDNGTASVPGIRQAAADRARILAFIAAGSDPNPPESDAVWFVRRAAVVSTQEGVTFLGVCPDELHQEMAAVAEALGREPDLSFLVDFQAEILTNYFHVSETGPTRMGPIERTAYDLVAGDPTPSTEP